MWNINEVGKEILADISKDIKGPNAMFEISSAAGKGPSEISHESKGEESNIHKKLVKNNQKALLMVKSFSSLFKLQQITFGHIDLSRIVNQSIELLAHSHN